MLFVNFYYFKHKTAYELRSSDWISDVCSSDLVDDVAWCDREVGRQVTFVDGLVQAEGVAGGSACAPAIQAGAVRRRELVDATRGQYRVEHGHALPVRDRDRLAHGPGHPDPREVLVAAQFGEDDSDLRIADVRAEFLLDVGRDLGRGESAGHHVADQR